MNVHEFKEKYCFDRIDPRTYEEINKRAVSLANKAGKGEMKMTPSSKNRISRIMSRSGAISMWKDSDIRKYIKQLEQEVIHTNSPEKKKELEEFKRELQARKLKKGKK